MRLFTPEEIEVIFTNTILSQNKKPDGSLYDQVNLTYGKCYLDDRDIEALSKGQVVIIQQCDAPVNRDKLKCLYYLYPDLKTLASIQQNYKSIPTTILKSLKLEDLDKLSFTRKPVILQQDRLDDKVRFRNGHEERILLTRKEVFLAKYHLLIVDLPEVGKMMIPFSAVKHPSKVFKRHRNFTNYVNVTDCIPLSTSRLIQNHEVLWESNDLDKLSEIVRFSNHAEAMFSYLKEKCVERIEFLKHEEQTNKRTDQVFSKLHDISKKYEEEKNIDVSQLKSVIDELIKLT